MTNTYVHAVAGASSGGGGGSVTLTGDVTGTGTSTVATTIASNAVTYAKIQTVGADKLLGNPTGSSAIPSEITLGTGLSFTGSTLNSSGSLPTLNAGSVVFSNGTTLAQDNTNFFYDSTNIGLSVGPGPHPTTSALFALTSPTGDTRTTLSVFSTSTNNSVQFENQNGFTLACLCASASNSPSINFERARGTLASKTEAMSGDILGSFVFNGYTGSADGSFAAAFAAIATENQTSGHAGAELVFETCANGTTTLVPRLIINQNGLVTVANLTPSTVVVADGSANLVSSSTTATEIGYVHGVTSSIQTQINSLAAPGVLYTPSNPSNWSTQPTTVQQALDLIATKLILV